MRIQFVEIANFRKLWSARIDFDSEKTVFVGAINSGKTPNEMAETIRLPEHLKEHAWLFPAYVDNEYNVRGQYRGIVGWYAEDTADLHPPTTKELGEVFTPKDLVDHVLSYLDSNIWLDQDKTWIDPFCGNGNFLIEIKNRLIQNGCSEEVTLSHIYGVDIMKDNVEECRKRLDPDNKYSDIVNKNIVLADALKYHYRFDNSNWQDINIEDLSKKVERDYELIEEEKTSSKQNDEGTMVDLGQFFGK